MTTGAIIFAQNNAGVDYVKLAVFAGNRIKTHLNIAVSIITDSKDYLEVQFADHPFEHIIELPYEQSLSHQQKKFYDGSLSHRVLDWKNLVRNQAYYLSPYDTTLVIDSDYVVSSSLLKQALDADYDFQIYQQSMDLAVDRDKTSYDRINQYSIPFYWATVFVFKKNDVMEAFFNLVSDIKINWEYFKILYCISVPMFRNDFAFSIAIHIMNGKTNSNFASALPGKMIYISDRDYLIDMKDHKMSFLVEKKDYLGEYIAVKTAGLDVHIMNKQSLGRFIDGGSGV